MPFYVEYTANQNATIRSAVDGNDSEEAFSNAIHTVREAGCKTATLRFTTSPSTIFGDGTAIARYAETTGWKKAEDGPK